MIHFAGLKANEESVRKPLEYFNVNVAGSVSLMMLMQKYNVKTLIFSSSATVYGVDNPKAVETDPITPVSPDGQTKAMVEAVMKDYSYANPDVSSIALRYFNPIGSHPSGMIGEDPRDIPNNLMPYIMKVANGHLPFLRVFGSDYNTVDGSGVRDYIHVMDLARGHLAALDKAPELSGYNAFNLGSGRGTSVLELVAAFEKASGL